MNYKTMENLKINNFLSEIWERDKEADLLYKLLEHRSILVSPVGSGKTTDVFRQSGKKIAEGRLAIIAVPTQGLVENKKSSYKGDDVVFGYGGEMANWDASKTAFTVYDTAAFIIAPNILPDTRVTLYIDEAHKLITETDFRKKALKALLELCNRPNFEVILMTATPNKLKNMGFNEVRVERETPEHQKINYFTVHKSQPISVAKTIIDRLPNALPYEEGVSRPLSVLRIQSKKAIRKALKHAEENNYKCIVIYSDGENGNRTLETLNKGLEAEYEKLIAGLVDGSIDIIFATSFIDAGLDLTTNYRDVAYHLVNNHDNSFPIYDIPVQSGARTRDAKSTEINVYGQFGESTGATAVYELTKAAETEDADYIVTKANNWVEDMGKLSFEATEKELKRFYYTATDAGKYTINRSESRTPKTLRPPYLIKNLAQNITQVHDEETLERIHKMLNMEAGSEPLDKEQSVEAILLYQNLVDAMVMGLDTKLYYGKKFQAEKLDDLVRVLKCFTDEQSDPCSSLRHLFKEAYREGKILKKDYLELSKKDQKRLKTFCVEIVGAPRQRFEDDNNIKLKRFRDWNVQIKDVAIPLGIPDEDIN